MADIAQKVLTSPTFINGNLQPAGAIVNVDPDHFPGADLGDEKAFPNLAEVGSAPVLMPTAVAAINPTGPAPRMPQMVPPGSMQTSAGYVNGEALLVAEGHPELAEMVKGAEAQNDGIEQEAITRLSATAQDAGTAGAGTSQSGTNGTETGSTGTGEPFTADRYVADVTIANANFDGLSATQLAAVREAEVNGGNRAGMLERIDAATAALTA